jgi:hypothetical protein
MGRVVVQQTLLRGILLLPVILRNLDAWPPSAPRDPAPLLLRPAQARLNFGSGPAHPALLTLVMSQDPSHYKLSTFNEGA